MRNSGQFLLLMLLVAGLLGLGSCGGGAGGSLGASLNQPGSSADGVTNGGFKAIRYNDLGYQDSALNTTLDIQVSQDGSLTTVTLAVNDGEPMLGACVDLYYNAAQFSPFRTEFAGLIDTPLEMAVTKTPGLVSVGQADTAGEALRQGEFATVVFANSPLRTVSAAGQSHQVMVNRTYAPAQAGAPNQSGFVITKAAIDATPAAYMIYSFFAQGDGDQNGSSNLGDLTAMVFNGYGTFAGGAPIDGTDWGTVPTDYDGNGETNPADLSTLGQRFNELSTGVEVMLADDGNDFSTNAGTVIQTFTWDDAAAPARPPTPGTDLAALLRDWSGTVDTTQATAADTDGDGSVAISARAIGGSAPGPAFTDAGAVITYPAGVPGVTILGFDVTIDATTDAVFTGAGGDATVIAGEEVTLNVTGINGNYDDGAGGGGTFSAADQTNIPPTSYADALAIVQGAVSWTNQNVGDSSTNQFGTTADVLSLSASSGSGVTAAVTPDSDNPDSTTSTTPEGKLIADLAQSGTFVPVGLTYDIRIDVEDDADAPVFTNLVSDAPMVGSYQGLDPAGPTQITGRFTPGAAALPADLADISAQLVEISPNPGGSVIDLTYTTPGPPSGGEYTLDNSIPGEVAIVAIISGSAIAGVVYGLHVSYDDGASGTTTSSVNYPDGTFFATGDPPPAATFETLPFADEIGPSSTHLFVFYPDPAMRRDPRVVFAAGVVDPVDPEGYIDRIKDNGAEFNLAEIQRNGTGPKDKFPQVICVAGTDASGITSTTSDTTGASVIYRAPGVVVLDIIAITLQGGTSTVDYAYKVFGGAVDQASWPTLGTGSFAFDPLLITTATPAGADFGVNAYDDTGRGDSTTADFSNKTLDGTTITTSQPDVIFVDATGIGMYDFDEQDPFDYGDNLPRSIKNTNMVFTETGGGPSMTVGVQPRIALSATGNVILTFEPTHFHWTNPGFPGWEGIFTAGTTYEVQLDDPVSVGIDFNFGAANLLTVVGTDPPHS